MMLVLVFSMICTVLITGVVAVTSVHLSRMRLLGVADGAALAAANALDDTAYRRGVGETVPLSDATVRQAAAAYVARRPKPTSMSSWGLGRGPTARSPSYACRASLTSRSSGGCSVRA